MKEYKEITLGIEARKKLKTGIDKVYDIVKVTLGGISRHVMVDYKGKAIPMNDGARIAQQIQLEDKTENIGAQAIIDVAMKTNDMVGDGTTTSMVLATKIIDEAMKKTDGEEGLVGAQTNLIKVSQEIKDEMVKVIAELKKMSKPIKEKEELDKISLVALGDRELSKIVSDMIWQVGQYGFVSTEENFGYKTEWEVTPGMKFPGTYAADALITNTRREAVYEGVPIIVANGTIENFSQIKPILTKIYESGRRNVVIITERYERGVIISIIKQTLFTDLKVLAIKAPALDSDEFEDIAIFCGATFFDKDKGASLENIQLIDLGNARRVIASRDDIVIVEGNGNKTIIKERIAKLKDHIKIEKADMFKKRIERRIAALAGSVGIIKVAANTEAEKFYLLRKVEDAVYACKAAMEEGIVAGGGIAFKKITEKMPNSILTEALKAPYQQIQENAGGKLKIGPEIIDPTKVMRIALENACSMASVFVATESSIVEPRNDLERAFRSFLQESKYDE